MKRIINPFNLLMWVIIYVVVAIETRRAPLVIEGRVGWRSVERSHGVFFNALIPAIVAWGDRPDGPPLQLRGEPDGSIVGWFNTVKVYRNLLEFITDDYLEQVEGRWI